MKIRMQELSVLLAVLCVGGCGYSQMTYMRKQGATVESERGDWALCGGNFQPDGQLWPSMDSKILSCMSQKGYASLNDYYVEQQISFFHRGKRTLASMFSREFDECGFGVKNDGGICGTERFIPAARLASAISCMSKFGYEPILPRYKWAYRIIDDSKPVPANFCLSITPRSGKGGVSLGGSRLE